MIHRAAILDPAAIHIRPAAPADAARLAALRYRFRSELAPPTEPDEAEHIAYLTNLFVLAEHRNQGLGARLLETAIAACPPERVATMILWPSAQSRALYERIGFQTPATTLERPLPHQG